MPNAGLLSLNVHDSLTFEGTELCLHPDLFATTSSCSTTVAVNEAASFHSTSNNKPSHVFPPPAFSAELLSPAPSGAGSDQHPANNNNSNTTHNHNHTHHPTHSNKSVLQVGDMVEIRVWDPLPTKGTAGLVFSSTTTTTTTASVASIVRSTTNSTSRGGGATPSISAASSTSSLVGPDSVARTLNLQPAAAGGSSSNNLQVQPSEDTSIVTEYEDGDNSNNVASRRTNEDLVLVDASASSTVSSGEGDSHSTNIPSNRTPPPTNLSSLIPTQQQRSSSGLPGTSPLSTDDNVNSTLATVSKANFAAPKDVITTTTIGNELPPVVPRSRTNTAENFIRPAVAAASTPVLAKPPLQRRSVSSNAPTAAANYQSTIHASNSSSRSRHYRDLSDMTVDTAYGNSSGTTVTPLDPSQQLLDFHLPTTTTSNGANESSGDTVVVVDDTDSFDWPGASSNVSQQQQQQQQHHPPHTRPEQASHTLRLSFVMLVTKHTLTSLKGSARTQISILRQVADLYHLSSYDMVSVHKVAHDEEKAALEAVSADFVTVTIKDQFISRGDMEFFQGTMLGSWVYEGQRLYEPTRGFQAHAREIRHQDKQALSGIVTDQTTVTFRSRSARIIWLVQISLEMWEYSQPYERGAEESSCEIYFDKWIAFVHKLFSKWKQLEVSHSLTVVFFSRSFTTGTGSIIGSFSETDVYGRRYCDHYRMVIENETGPDWESLILRVKEAFVQYPNEVGWALPRVDQHECRPSTASQGNVLEAINVTLNLLQFHYLDRDLHRTGNSIVIISAGNGVFEVDKGLAGISYQVCALFGGH